MKITKYAQSTFLIETGQGKRLFIDPGSYNIEQGLELEKLGQLDLLVITHKHADHFDLAATRSLVDLFQPLVLTNPEVGAMLAAEGISSTVPYDFGETMKIGGFSLTTVEADHVVRGETVENFGLVVESDGKRVYHTSDTRYIEPQLLSGSKVREPDILCLPISNRGLVMGIDDALYFANEIKPKLMIPMHYDSPKDRGRVGPEQFTRAVQETKTWLDNLSQISVQIISFGESLEI